MQLGLSQSLHLGDADNSITASQVVKIFGYKQNPLQNPPLLLFPSEQTPESSPAKGMLGQSDHATLQSFRDSKVQGLHIRAIHRAACR